jgi:hypothetical protein
MIYFLNKPLPYTYYMYILVYSYNVEELVNLMKGDYPRTLPVKLGQNCPSGIRGDVQSRFF